MFDICGKYKKPVAFVSIKASDFRARRNNCRNVANKIGISVTFLLCCMKAVKLSGIKL